MSNFMKLILHSARKSYETKYGREENCAKQTYGYDIGKEGGEGRNILPLDIYSRWRDNCVYGRVNNRVLSRYLFDGFQTVE